MSIHMEKSTIHLILVKTLLVASLYSGNLLAATVSNHLKYTVITSEATDEQLDPLGVIVNVEVPQTITSVGGALRFFLVKSGYTLSETPSTPEVILFTRNLPLVHRSFIAVRLKSILSALAGRAYQIQVDDVTREVSFELVNRNYRVSRDVTSLEAEWDLISSRPLHSVSGTNKANNNKPNTKYIVQADDMLWSIAEKNKPEGATVEQTVLSIVNANERAFLSGNINLLKSGVTLTIPSEKAIKALDRRESYSIVKGLLLGEKI